MTISTFFDWANKVCTPVGAIATAVAAVFAFCQLRSANITLYSSNSYKVQIDLITAYTQVLEAQSSSSPENLRRKALYLDALVESISALHNNDGLSEDSWIFVLRQTCAPLSKSGYKIDSVELKSTKITCDRNIGIWRDQPK